MPIAAYFVGTGAPRTEPKSMTTFASSPVVYGYQPAATTQYGAQAEVPQMIIHSLAGANDEETERIIRKELSDPSPTQHVPFVAPNQTEQKPIAAYSGAPRTDAPSSSHQVVTPSTQTTVGALPDPAVTPVQVTHNADPSTTQQNNHIEGSPIFVKQAASGDEDQTERSGTTAPLSLPHVQVSPPSTQTTTDALPKIFLERGPNGSIFVRNVKPEDIKNGQIRIQVASGPSATPHHIQITHDPSVGTEVHIKIPTATPTNGSASQPPSGLLSKLIMSILRGRNHVPGSPFHITPDGITPTNLPEGPHAVMVLPKGNSAMPPISASVPHFVTPGLNMIAISNVHPTDKSLHVLVHNGEKDVKVQVTSNADPSTTRHVSVAPNAGIMTHKISIIHGNNHIEGSPIFVKPAASSEETQIERDAKLVVAHTFDSAPGHIYMLNTPDKNLITVTFKPDCAHRVVGYANKVVDCSFKPQSQNTTFVVKYGGFEVLSGQIPSTVPLQSNQCGCDKKCDCSCPGQMIAEPQLDSRTILVKNVPHPADPSQIHVSVAVHPTAQVHVSTHVSPTDDGPTHHITQIGVGKVKIVIAKPSDGQHHVVTITHVPTGQQTQATLGKSTSIENAQPTTFAPAQMVAEPEVDSHTVHLFNVPHPAIPSQIHVAVHPTGQVASGLPTEGPTHRISQAGLGKLKIELAKQDDDQEHNVTITHLLTGQKAHATVGKFGAIMKALLSALRMKTQFGQHPTTIGAPNIIAEGLGLIRSSLGNNHFFLRGGNDDDIKKRIHIHIKYKHTRTIVRSAPVRMQVYRTNREKVHYVNYHIPGNQQNPIKIGITSQNSDGNMVHIENSPFHPQSLIPGDYGRSMDALNQPKSMATTQYGAQAEVPQMISHSLSGAKDEETDGFGQIVPTDLLFEAEFEGDEDNNEDETD